MNSSNNVSRLDPKSFPDRNPIVFRMNEAEWWVGYDLESVQLAFARSIGYQTLEDAQADNLFAAPRAISDRELDSVVTEDITCRELLQAMCDENAHFPCFFSSIARPDFWSSVRIAAPALHRQPLAA